MYIRTLLFICLAITGIRCSSPTAEVDEQKTGARALPRVLFLTTGISEGENQPAQGVIVALQSFNRFGVPVRLETRDILYNYKKLCQYNIIILSTHEGYHDADRKYSLSYMSDEEIHNLARFVAEGGVIISGENVGRNYPDGTDRIRVLGELTPGNWELASCFGVTFTERNVAKDSIQGEVPSFFRWETNSAFLSGTGQELWSLVPGKKLSGECHVMARWTGSGETQAAMVENHYQKGLAYFLPFSAYLHPANDGGLWNEDQISSFYQYVIDRYNKLNGVRVSLNPWPSGKKNAFCVSLNAEGDPSQYERVFALLEREKIEPLVFVNGLVNKEIKSYLTGKAVDLASNGYAYSEYRQLDYPRAVDDILRNENYWEREFHGFRFPYTRPGFWGLMALDGHGYYFESSIGANNIDFFHGSVVPYNLVMANEGYYKSSQILEIAPTYHDDYYFLNTLGQELKPDSLQLDENVKVYGQYLRNYWQFAVKPYDGLMVFLGHPKYVGYSDVTLSALEELIRTVKEDDSWITTLEEAAIYRDKLSQIQFFTSDFPDGQQITLEAPEGLILSDVCLNINGKIKSASASKGKVKVQSNDTLTGLIFEATKGQVIRVSL
jgi:peptidoglycan/xylan/chitin deacetylase (PgdA/CDA1 family)